MGFEPVISCGKEGNVTVVKPQPRTYSLDLDNSSVQTAPSSQEINSVITCSAYSDVFISCDSLVYVDSTKTPEYTPGDEGRRDLPCDSVSEATDSFTSKEAKVFVEHMSTLSHTVSPGNENGLDPVTEANSEPKQLTKDSKDEIAIEASQSNGEPTEHQYQIVLSAQSDQGSTSSAPVSEGDSGIDPFTEGGEEDKVPAGGSLTERATSKTEIKDLTAVGGLAKSPETSSKVEQQDKKKGENLL